MSLEHDGFIFSVNSHGPVKRDGQAEFPQLRHRFFSIRGESHINGQMYGRDLTCRIVLRDLNTLTALQADLDTLDDRAGTLTGTLTEIVNGETTTFDACTYQGYTVDRGPSLDGSGQHGWWAAVVLRWRQRAQ